MLGLCGFFYVATVFSNGTNNNADKRYTFLATFDACPGNGIKTITIFICRRYNRPQSQFSNQKSIANEKHQPNADRCLAGTTETL
jgi:hypothetical protein